MPGPALGVGRPIPSPRAGLAKAYHAAERLTDAATLLRDTLSRCEQELSPGDPLTQILRHTMTDLGGVWASITPEAMAGNNRSWCKRTGEGRT